jgi:N6-adenosine-specific RNA methylase IME4
MRQLGFKYIRTLPWIKLTNEAFEEMLLEKLESPFIPARLFRCLLKKGIGQYFRGSSELLLFGVRGKGMNVRTEALDIGNVIIAPRGAHSRKPEAAFEIIEARSIPPYAEIFARPPARPGWAVWGNECLK